MDGFPRYTYDAVEGGQAGDVAWEEFLLRNGPGVCVEHAVVHGMRVSRLGVCARGRVCPARSSVKES